MTMKKTDLYKNLGKQIDRQQKAAARPDRFGAGAAQAGQRARKPETAARLVPLTCRLPAELVNNLRERALTVDGGVSALVAQAVDAWLAAPQADADPE